MPDSGQKTPIVLIPGIQGRWEWMAPAVKALDPDFEVLTFTLSDVPKPTGAPAAADGWFGRWTEHIDRLLDQAGGGPAVIAGVSFGGLVALWYAAARPD